MLYNIRFETPTFLASEKFHLSFYDGSYNQFGFKSDSSISFIFCREEDSTVTDVMSHVGANSVQMFPLNQK